jgi:hypothetical protein
MWERLTPADLARATEELDLRRAETLQRHAAELRDLDADRAEIDRLEQAIDVFVRQFHRPDAEGEVRLQAYG